MLGARFVADTRFNKVDRVEFNFVASVYRASQVLRTLLLAYIKLLTVITGRMAASLDSIYARGRRFESRRKSDG